MLAWTERRAARFCVSQPTPRPPNYLGSRMFCCYSPYRETKRQIVMKMRSFLLPIVLLVFSIISADGATVITFDDLSEAGSGTFLANGYQGLNWSNFGILNAVLRTNLFGISGYYYGMVSASNVAWGGFISPTEIDSPTNFDFFSTYLTGAWNSNLNVEVKGFNGVTMLFDTTVVASATSPSLFTFNYLNINRLTFDSSGGQSAGFPNGSGEHFAMDNFTFEFIPEPSSFLLAGFGALALWPFLKRKRVQP